MLIGHWPLNGNIDDYSGFNRNGTIVGSLTSNNSGKIGKTYNFTNSNNGVAIQHNFAGLTEYTMAAWICPKGTHQNYNGTVFSSGNWNGTCWAFGVNQNNTAIDVAGRGYNKYINYTLTLNTWYHILSTVKNGVSKLYVNGVYIGETSVSALPLASDAADTCIGRETYADGHFSFNGLINDVRIYDNILSEYEIQELAKAKILHYTFDDPYEEPTTNICYDLALNYYDKSRFYATDGDGFSEVLIENKKWMQYNSGSRRLASIPISANTTYTWSLKIISPIYSSISFTQWDSGGYGSRSYVINEGYNEVSHTFTSRANSTSEILHLGSFPVGSKLADFQLEAKDHFTPITNGTRNIGVNDISGYKHTGSLSVISNSPKWVTDSKVGSGSIYFNGTDPHIISGLTNFGGLTTVTISFWRKNDTRITDWLPFVGQTTSHYIMATSSGTGGFYHSAIGSSWEIFKDGVAQGPLVAATPFTDKLWHHYVIRGVDLSAWTMFKISGYGEPWYIEGYIDDIRIYNTNLSNSDIKSLYERKVNLDNLGNIQLSGLDINGIGTSNSRSIVPYENITPGTYTTSQNFFNLEPTGTDGDRNRISIAAVPGYNVVVGNSGNPWGQIDRTLRVNILTTHYSQYQQLGINYYFNLNNTKTYRITQWVYTGRVTARSYSQNNYFGILANTVCNLNTTTANTNPYFTSPVMNATQVANKWALYTYYVYPYGSTGNPSNNQGFYYTDGSFVNYGTNFNWNTSSSSYIRQYIMYQYGEIPAGSHVIIYRPRIEIVDGTEEPIENLITSGVHRPITDALGTNTFDKKSFDKLGQGKFSGIDEVSGTKNSAAQHEITNTGALIINGEFSEVD